MDKEQKLYDTLKTITQYQSADKLRRDSEKDWGCSYEEALEMAYENVLQTARMAIKGMRRPKCQ